MVKLTSWWTVCYRQCIIDVDDAITIDYCDHIILSIACTCSELATHYPGNQDLTQYSLPPDLHLP